MSDWDFLYEMKYLGYSEAEIQDAMASGAAPYGHMNGLTLKNKKRKPNGKN